MLKNRNKEIDLKKLLSVIFASALMLLISCEVSDECNSSTVAGVNFTLQKKANSIVTGFVITSMDLPNDTVYNSASSSSYIKTLPLSVSNDTTAFVFTATDTIDTSNDFIVFYHTMNLTFLDEPCGFVPDFKLDSIKYTDSKLDSIVWVFKDVTTDIESENITVIY